MTLFQDKVVLIRGAGQGLGRKLAVGFARQGAHIAASDVSPLHLSQTANIIRGGSGTCHTYDHDMSKKHFIQGTIADIQTELGIPDILILAHFLNPEGTLENLDDWDWQHSLDVNLSGAFYTIQSYLRIAGETLSRKHIITILPDQAQSGLEIMKHGLLGLTAAAAREGAARDVAANAIASSGFEENPLLQTIYRLCADPSSSPSGELITAGEPFPLQAIPF